MGGALEHPATRFPALFGGSKFWTDYPYFLPCLWGSVLCFFTFVIGSAFLQEVRSTATSDQLRDTTVTSFCYRVKTLKSSPNIVHAEYESLAQEPSTPLASHDEEERPELPPTPLSSRSTPSMRAVLVRPVLFAVLNYASLALLDIAFFSINTVFFAVPISAGGLGFSPATLGLIFAVQGVFSGSVQLFAFPKVHKRWGAKRILRASLATFGIIFPLYPLMHMAAKRWGSNSVPVWMGLFTLVCITPMVDMGYSEFSSCPPTRVTQP